MKKKAVIILVLVLAVLAAVLVWRLVPRSFAALGLGPVPQNLACTLSVAGFQYDEETQAAEPSIESWRIELSEQGQAPFDAILALLQGAKYRPDFSNLLPAAPSSYEGGGGQSIVISFGTGSSLSILGDMVCVMPDGGRITCWYFADPATAQALVECIKTHGEKQ